MNVGLPGIALDVDQRGAPRDGQPDAGSVEIGEYDDEDGRAGNGGGDDMTPAAPAAPVEAEPTFTG
ncbi:MAG: hypothetical protein WA903_10010 [Ornithinimicrobium sp.]